MRHLSVILPAKTMANVHHPMRVTVQKGLVAISVNFHQVNAHLRVSMVVPALVKTRVNVRMAIQENSVILPYVLKDV